MVLQEGQMIEFMPVPAKTNVLPRPTVPAKTNMLPRPTVPAKTNEPVHDNNTLVMAATH